MTDINAMIADADRLRSRIEAKQKAQPTSAPWYAITNATDDVAHVRIYDEIGMWGVDAESFATDIGAITASTIEVAINSPGGSVFQGLAIYNALRTHPARVVTRVDGLAASAASFIAQAGDERAMVESSQMMIHNAMASVFGNADDLRDVAEFLDKQTVNIAELYASRSDQTADRYLELMADETWMTAAEAVAEGLADRVLVPNRQPTNTSPVADESAAAARAAAADIVAAPGEQHEQRARAVRDITLRKVLP